MTRVAINGFGRIGRNFLRAYLERRPDYEIVAVNDVGKPKTMAHLLEFDSVLGRLPDGVEVGPDTITVGELELRAFSIPDPAISPGGSSASTWLSKPPAASRSATRRRRT